MPDAGIHTPDANEEQPLLPVRRLHNYAYCPRLAYLQWVENVFVENADTVAGSSAHRNVDRATSYDDEKKQALSDNLEEGRRLRSLHLTSERLRLTGIVDLVEGDEDGVRVIDYKRGSALRDSVSGARHAKPYDSIQVAAHALLLRENGHTVVGGSIYYAADRRHVEVELDETLLEETKELIKAVRASAANPKLPDPLIDDIRCAYCSAHPVCLPKESAWWAQRKAISIDPQLLLSFADSASPEEETEELMDESLVPPRPERNEGEILVVQTPGAQIGQRGGEITVSIKREVIRRLPLQQVRSVYIYGAVQMTAQATQSCLAENVDVAYFAPSGRYLGALQGLPASGVDGRRGQYRLFELDYCRVRLARECVFAKIRNQRVMLMRNGSPQKAVVHALATAARNARTANSIGEIRGIEGGAAAIYFKEFAGMLKGEAIRDFDFHKRSRRPPKDPVNALLSLGYSILAKELAGICHAVGLDPFFGFFHEPRYGRPALALDLMEEFRPLIPDSVAISLINRGELDADDFLFTARGVSLKDSGRRRFWEGWFKRLDTEVTHPEFGYKMSYRRMMEVQVRQLWRYVRTESTTYLGFTTR